MNSLEELATRCEAATGPDREIDRLISVACGYTATNALGQTVYMHGRTSGSLSQRRYTASLDAAMTLVPEGYARESKQVPGQRAHYALLTLSLNGTKSHQSVAATMPLAICAAALRARTTSETSNAE